MAAENEKLEVQAELDRPKVSFVEDVVELNNIGVTDATCH